MNSKIHIGTPSQHGTHNANILFDEDAKGVAAVYNLPTNATLEDIEGVEQWQPGLATARFITEAVNLAVDAQVVKNGHGNDMLAAATKAILNIDGWGRKDIQMFAENDTNIYRAAENRARVVIQVIFSSARPTTEPTTEVKQDA
jgi:hypothetical protein